MPEAEGPPGAELPRLAAAIERAARDLALAEEPARFIAALEGEAPPRPAPEAGRD